MSWMPAVQVSGSCPLQDEDSTSSCSRSQVQQGGLLYTQAWVPLQPVCSTADCYDAGKESLPCVCLCLYQAAQGAHAC